MRLAAVADIHGNCLALEAVLADIRRLEIDIVVNLGDHLSGPLEAQANGRLADRVRFSIDPGQSRPLADRAGARRDGPV